MPEPPAIVEAANPKPLPAPLRGELRFEHVSFRYPTRQEQLALDRLARLVVPELGDFAVLAFVRDDATVPLVRPDAPVAEQVVGRAAGGRAPLWTAGSRSPSPRWTA